MSRRSKLVFRSISAVLTATFLLNDFALAASHVPAESALARPFALSVRIPESVALMEDSFRAAGSGKTLVLVQDAHTNESCQLNTASALDAILDKEGIRYVFLEGGTGDDSLSFLREEAPLAHRRRVALSYLKQGEVSGSEYLDLTSSRDLRLWGVEDKSLYWESLETYRAIAEGRAAFQEHLSRVRAAIQALKSRTFNPSLSDFDAAREAYLDEKLSSSEYFEVLLENGRSSGLTLSGYEHLRKIRKLRSLERSIDFAKASNEQAEAVRALPKDDLRAFAALSSAASDRSPFKVSSADRSEEKAFYALLSEKTELAHFPELSKYLRYLNEAGRLEPKRVLEEQSALENALLSRLARTPDESALVRSSEGVRRLRRLFDLSLTPTEFEDYRARSREFGIVPMTAFLNGLIAAHRANYDRLVFLEDGWDPYVAKAERFYELTRERDLKIVANVLAKMDAEGEKKAVLVAGGYHAPSLKALLKENNVSFVSLVPQVLQETNLERYERILLSQKPSDARFSGSATHKAILPLVERPIFTRAILPAIRERRTEGGESIGSAAAGTIGGRPAVVPSAQVLPARDRAEGPSYAPAAARMAEAYSIDVVVNDYDTSMYRYSLLNPSGDEVGHAKLEEKDGYTLLSWIHNHGLPGAGREIVREIIEREGSSVKASVGSPEGRALLLEAGFVDDPDGDKDLALDVRRAEEFLFRQTVYKLAGKALIGPSEKTVERMRATRGEELQAAVDKLVGADALRKASDVQGARIAEEYTVESSVSEYDSASYKYTFEDSAGNVLAYMDVEEKDENVYLAWIENAGGSQFRTQGAGRELVRELIEREGWAGITAVPESASGERLLTEAGFVPRPGDAVKWEYNAARGEEFLFRQTVLKLAGKALIGPRKSTVDRMMKTRGEELRAAVDQEKGMLAGIPYAVVELADRDLTGQKVIVRANLNVPFDSSGRISDTARLKEYERILKFLLKRNATVVLIGHGGRKNEDPLLDNRHSFAPVAEFLRAMLPGVPVTFHEGSVAKDDGLTIGPEAITGGGIHLIENVRFSDSEEAKKDDPTRREFARKLAALGDGIVILDAFADVGSKGASIEDLPVLAREAYAGPGMSEEFGVLAEVSNEFDALVFGGAKLEKLDLLDGLVSSSLSAKGFALIGSGPSVELNGPRKDALEDIRTRNSSEVLTTVDYKETSNTYDIGPETTRAFLEKLDSLKKGQTALINGTMGFVEHASGAYAAGTKAVFEKLGELADRGVRVIVVGGDASANARQYGLEGKENVVFFTGGGVPLKVLANEKLVGIEALRKANGARLAEDYAINSDTSPIDESTVRYSMTDSDGRVMGYLDAEEKNSTVYLSWVINQAGLRGVGRELVRAFIEREGDYPLTAYPGSFGGDTLLTEAGFSPDPDGKTWRYDAAKGEEFLFRQTVLKLSGKALIGPSPSTVERMRTTRAAELQAAVDREKGMLAGVPLATVELRDRDLTGRKVLVRVNLDVPVETDGALSETSRLIDAEPAVRFLLRRNASVVLLGRAERGTGSSVDFASVAEALREVFPNDPVTFHAGSVTSKGVAIAPEVLAAPGIHLIDNLAVAAAENAPQDDPARAAFARSLAALGDGIYVFDSAAEADSKVASVVDLPGLVREAYLGPSAAYEFARREDTAGKSAVPAAVAALRPATLRQGARSPFEPAGRIENIAENFAFSADGSTVTAILHGLGSSKIVSVLDAVLLTEIFSERIGTYDQTAIAPDGRRLAWYDIERAGSAIEYRDLSADAEVAHRFVTVGETPLDAVFSEGGRFLAAGYRSGRGVIRDVDSRKTVSLFGDYAPLRGMSFAPGDLFYYPTGQGIDVIDATTGELRMRFDGAQSAAFSPYGDRAAAADYAQILIFDSLDEDEQVSIPLPFGELSVARLQFSPDGRLLVASRSDKIAVFDAFTGAERFRAPANSGYFAFSPDSSVMVLAEEGNISAVDTATFEVSPIGEQNGKVLKFAFSPDGKAILTGSTEEIRRWERVSGARLAIEPITSFEMDELAKRIRALAQPPVRVPVKIEGVWEGTGDDKRARFDLSFADGTKYRLPTATADIVSFLKSLKIYAHLGERDELNVLTRWPNRSAFDADKGDWSKVEPFMYEKDLERPFSANGERPKKLEAALSESIGFNQYEAYRVTSDRATLAGALVQALLIDMASVPGRFHGARSFAAAALVTRDSVREFDLNDDAAMNAPLRKDEILLVYFEPRQGARLAAGTRLADDSRRVRRGTGDFPALRPDPREDRPADARLATLSERETRSLELLTIEIALSRREGEFALSVAGEDGVYRVEEKKLVNGTYEYALTERATGAAIATVAGTRDALERIRAEAAREETGAVNGLLTLAKSSRMQANMQIAPAMKTPSAPQAFRVSLAPLAAIADDAEFRTQLQLLVASIVDTRRDARYRGHASFYLSGLSAIKDISRRRAVEKLVRWAASSTGDAAYLQAAEPSEFKGVVISIFDPALEEPSTDGRTVPYAVGGIDGKALLGWSEHFDAAFATGSFFGTAYDRRSNAIRFESIDPATFPDSLVGYFRTRAENPDAFLEVAALVRAFSGKAGRAGLLQFRLRLPLAERIPIEILVRAAEHMLKAVGSAA